MTGFWGGFMLKESERPGPRDHGDEWRRDERLSTGPRRSRFSTNATWQDTHDGVGSGVVQERAYYRGEPGTELEGLHGVETEETIHGPRWKDEQPSPQSPNDTPSNPKRKWQSLDPESRYIHGSRARYVDGCRCEVCTMANRLYIRDYRRKKAS